MLKDFFLFCYFRGCVLEAVVISTRAIDILDDRSQGKKAVEVMITSHLFGEGTKSFRDCFLF